MDSKIILLLEKYFKQHDTFVMDTEKLRWYVRLDDISYNRISFSLKIEKQDKSFDVLRRKPIMYDGYEMRVVSRPQMTCNIFYLRGSDSEYDELEDESTLHSSSFYSTIHKAIGVTLKCYHGQLTDYQISEMIVDMLADGNIDEIEVECKQCKSHIKIKDLDGGFCKECLKESFQCEKCNELHSVVRMNYIEIDNKKMCLDCCKEEIASSDGGAWREYAEKPIPNNFGQGNLYGVELEVEFIGSSSSFDVEDTVRFLTGRSNHLYFKHDGSLNNGLEMITHPSSIEYHRDNTLKLLPLLEKFGFEAQETCGLHIHASKSDFGNTTMEKAINIGRLLWLTIHFSEELIKLSERTKYGYCNPNGRPKNLDDKRAMLGATIRDEDTKTNDEIALAYITEFYRHSDRYKVINLNFAPTVEYRLPNSTLDKLKFMAHLQMFDRMINIAKSNIDFTQQSFEELFVGHAVELDVHIKNMLSI